VIQAVTFPTFPLEKPRRGYTFEEYDHRGTERLVQASAAAGVERFVFTSGVGVAPDAPKTRHRAKWRGEEAIRATGISHAIIRPTWVYGPEDQALNRFAWFARHLPFVPVIGDGSQRMQPVFIDDVAEVMAQAADSGGPVGTFELGGPEVMTMNEVLATMTEVMRRRRPLVHFPPALPRLAGFFLQVVPKQPLSPAAVDFVLDDAVGDTGSLLASFDVRLTALRDGLETYLRP
jgi:NADH dehydrogenase